MNVLDQITEEYKKNDIPNFGVGDTVKVHIKIKEGTRERIQVFEGFVLKRQNGGVAETFTVRRIASGVGVEKTFPIHSPKIEKIEVVKRGDVRRARLHYMRERTGKSAKIKTKIYQEGKEPVVEEEIAPAVVVEEVPAVEEVVTETVTNDTEPNVEVTTEDNKEAKAEEKTEA